MHDTTRQALAASVNEAADDIGRLRAHTAYTGSLAHAVDRLADVVCTAAWLAWPCAAELVRDGWDAAQAVDHVDHQHNRLLRRMRDDLREAARVATLEEVRAA